MVDEELQNLMRQVVESRKMEKDYKGLEHQIRCLKKRMFQHTEVVEDEAGEAYQKAEQAQAHTQEMLRTQ